MLVFADHVSQFAATSGAIRDSNTRGRRCPHGVRCRTADTVNPAQPNQVRLDYGGRQLDQVVAPLDMLPEVRERVGDQIEVLVDSGIRRGLDIALALALGADAVLVGRDCGMLPVPVQTG